MKIAALIVALMIMLLSVIASVTPGSRGYKKPIAVVEVGKEIAKPLSRVDTIAPEISNALGKVDVKLTLPGAKKDKLDDDRSLTDYSGAVFSNKDLPRTNFAGSIISAAQFNDALLDGSVLEGVSGVEANFRGARLAKANLSAASLAKSDFAGAELREAIARSGDFRSASFVGADLSFAAFSGSKFQEANLSDIYAAGAIFIGADLTGVDFAGADLTGVRFERANLAGAKFAGADIKLAKFTGAKLYGADLSGALNATAEQLSEACADGDTMLPEGLPATRC